MARLRGRVTERRAERFPQDDFRGLRGARRGGRGLRRHEEGIGVYLDSHYKKNQTNNHTRCLAHLGKKITPHPLTSPLSPHVPLLQNPRQALDEGRQQVYGAGPTPR